MKGAALRERRDQLRNELRGDPRFQEFEQVCQLLWLYESREAAEPARDVKPASAAPATSARPSASRQAPSAVASSSAARPEPASRAPAAPRPLFVPSPTGMRAVIDAAAEYLREKGDRADSAEIEGALIEKGILKGGPADRSKVTSYLGRTKNVFDNVKGQGYGLKEWREPAGAARERSV